jgi:hypothetical protein
MTGTFLRRGKVGHNREGGHIKREAQIEVVELKAKEYQAFQTITRS